MSSDAISPSIALALAAIFLVIIFGTLLIRRDRIAGWCAKLQATAFYDLVKLTKYRAVSVKAAGRTITQIYAQIENHTRRSFGVLITSGTYFIAQGPHQNMVVYSEQRIYLRSLETKRIALLAACLNAERPIPAQKDPFIGVAKVGNELQKFFEQAKGLSPSAIQAGIWAITDSYSSAQIQRRLYIISNGVKKPGISAADIAEAKRILDLLGIRNYL